MFSSIELKNYKCFKDISVSFKNKKGSLKPTILIYGENGTGKTSFISSFSFLRKSLLSLTNNYLMLEYLQVKKVDGIESGLFFGSALFNLKEEAAKVRRYESNGHIYLKYGITINKRDYFYVLEFNENNELILEKLYRENSQQEYEMFTITPKSISYGRGTFDHYQTDILTKELKKYWGSYTLFSIIVSQIQQGNRHFVRDEIHKSLRSILTFMLDMHINCTESGYEHQDFLNLLQRVEVNMEEGVTSKNAKLVLEKGETLARDLLNWFNPSIKDAYYRFEENGDTLTYKLYLKKQTEDGILDIPYTAESRGTKKFIKLIMGLVDAAMGQEFIMDGFDDGLHEFVVYELFEKELSNLKNQNILSLSSTYVMSIADPGSIYIATETDGKHEIICIQDITATQENHNNRARYEKGVFGRDFRESKGLVPGSMKDFIHGSETILRKKNSNILTKDD